MTSLSTGPPPLHPPQGYPNQSAANFQRYFHPLDPTTLIKWIMWPNLQCLQEIQPALLRNVIWPVPPSRGERSEIISCGNSTIAILYHGGETAERKPTHYPHSLPLQYYVSFRDYKINITRFSPGRLQLKHILQGAPNHTQLSHTSIGPSTTEPNEFQIL